MTRKDSEKDAERPHYYSQFWLDIAAGRRVIGGPKSEEAEINEPEMPEPVPVREAGYSIPGTSDGYQAAYVSPTVEAAPEEVEEEEPEELIDEIELPNILVEEEQEDSEESEEPIEEVFSEGEEFFDEEEEEDEESEDWGRRGRKKAKPSRPTKPTTKSKRSPRRSF